MSFSYQVQHAQLQWDEQGLPYAPDYEDVYYSRSDALGESTHVFLEGNRLPERFAALRNRQFIIGELGFGAGLNFLNTCRLWCGAAPAGATLHYLACEKHPLCLADLQALHRQFPELAKCSAALLTHWPEPCKGVHQLTLRIGQHRIVLSLLYGPAIELEDWVATTPGLQVDAWFLDGFSPAHNPEMWSSALFQQVARFCHADSTLCSYSVAGSVRRDLESAGFVWEKLPGFAGKRHMLRAASRHADRKRLQAADPASRRICVVGAGLAGCSTARALAESGWQVVLLDSAAVIASAASGNPQGVLHFKPATVDSPENRFNLHAYLFAARHYRTSNLPEELWSGCGMLQVAPDEKWQKRLTRLAQSGLYGSEVLQVLDNEQASHIAGCRIKQGAVYFPAAGWLNPQALCAWYVAHPDIELHCEAKVLQVQSGPQGWQLQVRQRTGEEVLHCRHVVLCNAQDVHDFVQTRHIPVIGNRGQVDMHRSNADTALGPVLCGQGYIIPPGTDGVQCVGGSFSITGDSLLEQESASRLHLEQLSTINAGLADAFRNVSPLEQRRTTRCTLADRMPVCGLVVESAHEENALWVNIGHGSQGLARTPVCAALLASQINRSPAPLEALAQKVLRPQRFGTE